MADLQPNQSKNLGGPDRAELPWQRALDQLRSGVMGKSNTVLSTTCPDGRPHATVVGAIWLDGDVYFQSGAGSRKARNLTANPACSVTASLPGIDLSFEGVATREVGPKRLEAVAAHYRQHGWPAEVEGEGLIAPFNAPGTGPGPWNVYRMDVRTVFGVATEEPEGAARWTFDREG